VRPKAAAIGPKIQASFAKDYKTRVKIAFGTDSSVSKHGENAKAFQYMVEAGMPAMKAIQSATRVASELIGMQHKLGMIGGHCLWFFSRVSWVQETEPNLDFGKGINSYICFVECLNPRSIRAFKKIFISDW